MLLINNFRVQVFIAYHKIKANIASFLIKIVSLLDQEVVKNAIVGLKTAISIQKYVPADDKWHHFDLTLQCWVKRNKKKTMRKVKKNIFIDGIKTRRK